jgi:P pilus assembly chaperone PapD
MRRNSVLVMVFLALGIASAWTMNVEPLSMEFAPAGRESIRSFRVSNSQSEMIAVRIRVTTRELLPSGEESRNPADDSFLIFPSRLVLEPGQVQAVRVQWRGSAQLAREAAYRIIFEQVPVEDVAGEPDRGGGVSVAFMYRYVGAMYVTPPEATPDVVLASTVAAAAGSATGGRSATGAGAGSDWVEADAARRTGVAGAAPRGTSTHFLLTFENRGTRHTVVRDATVVIEGEGADGRSARCELTGADLAPLIGTNLLAGARIEQLITLDEPIRAATLTVIPDLTLSPQGRAGAEAKTKWQHAVDTAQQLLSHCSSCLPSAESPGPPGPRRASLSCPST